MEKSLYGEKRDFLDFERSLISFLDFDISRACVCAHAFSMRIKLSMVPDTQLHKSYLLTYGIGSNPSPIKGHGPNITQTGQSKINQRINSVVM